MSIFEATMLICFGAAWPISIYKSWKSKSNEGKSLFFMIIILVGYLSGVLHKIIYNFDFIVWLYVLNLLMVIFDISLYTKYSSFTKKLGDN